MVSCTLYLGPGESASQVPPPPSPTPRNIFGKKIRLNSVQSSAFPSQTSEQWNCWWQTGLAFRQWLHWGGLSSVASLGWPFVSGFTGLAFRQLVASLGWPLFRQRLHWGGLCFVSGFTSTIKVNTTRTYTGDHFRHGFKIVVQRGTQTLNNSMRCNRRIRGQYVL